MKKSNPLFCLLVLVTTFVIFGCQSGANKNEFSIDYEKYVLSNGLEVVLHEDKSDPIVAVAIQYHVGSNREKPGKTGFAHFFEHMLFQRSENLARNEFFSKINDLGGSFNGGTWTDGTIYYEQVPNDALEKILWMESDRMGFFINTVTQQGLEREIDVVINEKRQGVDNRAYGHTDGVIRKALYPYGHPYSWTVIGEIADLQAATVEDVKEFYQHYYGPNNATLVIAGNFDKEQTKAWVEKYFGEIAPRGTAEKPMVQIAELDKDILLYHEDKFANMPELTIIYPAPQMFQKDAYALNILTSLLTSGKKAPIYKEIVENTKLAPSVRMYNNSMELAGEIQLIVRAFPGKDLNEVYAAIKKGMDEFETNGVDPADLQRIKTMRETSFYSSISSVMNKAFQIAEANASGGSPEMMQYNVKMLNDVTPEDVMRVYRTYVKNQPAVMTSFVPMGQKELALAGSLMAEVTEEKVEDQGMKSEAGAIVDEGYERTASNFDRSIEPPLGILSELTQPEVWKSSLSNGIKIHGIEHNELPLAYFVVSIPAGSVSESKDKAGLAYLTAQVLREGTKNKTPEELEDAIKDIGATLSIGANQISTNIVGFCLSRNTNALVALMEEILTQPRWDEKEFERIKSQNTARLQEQKVQPNAIASKVFNKIVLGDNAYANSILGTIESLQNITIDDLKQFFADYYVPAKSSLLVIGNSNDSEVQKAFATLSNNWKDIQGKPIELPEVANPPTGKKLYFVDYPGANQSVIFVGKQAMTRRSDTYYPAMIANYKLGDGSASDLFRILRLERGYTYGAYSSFDVQRDFGTFMASSSVQTSVTKEAVELFRDIIADYGVNYTDKDLETTRNALLRQESGAYETLNSAYGILYNIVITGLPEDYLKKEEQVLRTIKTDELKQVIAKEMNINDMIVVVVGDAKSQLSRLRNLGFGEPILVKAE